MTILLLGQSQFLISTELSKNEYYSNIIFEYQFGKKQFEKKTCANNEYQRNV